ncbi:MAG: hypothetical protein ABIN80_23055, partial [Dyadobacter sp.]|uniref:hypothetical protein n=1 Tax=Dyadobacter sp. TaxID=1914288 RepID=UPI003265CFC8
MAIVVTPPEKIGFSKNDLPWVFEDDREGIVPGIQSETILSIDNPVLAGSQIIFRWGENDLRFTAAELPGLYGSEFPTYPVWDIATHETYVKSLVPYFAGNYFLQKDFTVQAHPVTISGPLGSVTLWTIKLTARLAGTAFNLNKTVFSGGGLTPSVTGTNDSTVVNNSVYVEVWMQTADASMYQLKYNATQPFDESSTAVFDVSAVLHSNLASEIPDMVLPVAERCNQSRRKYYLRYALAGGQNLSIGTLQQTDDHVVLLGGFAQWKTGPQSLIDTFKKSNSVYKLLSLRPALRVVRQDEPVFVSWVNFGASGKNIYARATVLFADGTELTTNTAVITGVLEYEKLIFGVGFKQLNLGYFNGTGRTVKEFTITIQDDLGAVSEPYRLVVNYAHLEYVRYFAYVNLYGSIDTLMTYGKGSSNWKVFKEQAQKVLPYNFQSTQAQFVDWNATYQDNQEVATGWMRKKELALWLDLFISPLKYRIIKGSAYAVQVNSDTIQRGSDGDNQYGLIFEYQFARIFDSLDEQLLEGEDTQDYIPANVVLAGSLETSTGGGGTSGPPVLRVDPYPISNSDNPVSSDGVFRALAGLQKKLPAGLATDFYNGQGLPRNLKTAVNAAETDPTVPSYAKSLDGLSVIFNGLQAMSPGLNVNLFGGQLSEWYIKRMTHPAFDELPPIVVSKGLDFTRYLDLKNYKESYHPNEELTVDVTYNSLKAAGVEVTVDGLIIKLSGKLDDSLPLEENVLLAVRDLFGNQKVLSLRVQTNDDEPEPEDPYNNLTDCQVGPFHYMKTAIEIFNNGKIRVPYDSVGVNPLQWKIVNNDTDIVPLHAGTSPSDNGPFFIAEFLKLPGQTYRIGIRGAICKSQWVFRDLVLPIDTTINWAAGYPKYNDQGSFSEFLAKIDQSMQALTELLNVTTNTKLYSVTHDYVANVTEIQVWKSPKYPDGVYRLSVGSLSKDITVGTPPGPPAVIFKLVNGYDGSTIKDLLTGAFDGDLPSGGFNGYFKATNIGFTYTYASLKLYYEVAGVYTDVSSAGVSFSTGGIASSSVQVMRLFNVAGTDSRVIAWNNEPINRGGKFKIVAKFTDGEGGPVKGTFEQLFELNQLKVYGGWYNRSLPGSRVVPVLGDLRYNGVRIINNNVWSEPWLSSGLGDRRIEFSFDKVTWYGTSSWFDAENGNTALSNIMLLNSAPGVPVDLFPLGTNKTIYLRDGMKHSVISEPYQINQAGQVALLGTYDVTTGGRRMTQQKS